MKCEGESLMIYEKQVWPSIDPTAPGHGIGSEHQPRLHRQCPAEDRKGSGVDPEGWPQGARGTPASYGLMGKSGGGIQASSPR